MAESRLEERIANPEIRWYFSKEELHNSPSRSHGVDSDKELSYRQQTANLIQEMGNRLKLNQICTATAIVYMHRFFMVHSFRTFNRYNVASAALFLAAKVEEQPQKLEYVARVYHSHMNRDSPSIDSESEAFTKLVEEITTHEVLILETLGFDLRVEHAHPHVVKCTQLVRASKDLSQTAYFMAHNSLLLTTFCLEHRPTVVACCCINLACVWKGIEIPPSQDQKKWWEYVDPHITQELLDSLTKEFLNIYGKSPSKLQKKIQEQIKLAQKQNKLKGDESAGTGTSQGERAKGHENSHSHSSSSSAVKHPKSQPPTSSSNQIPSQKLNSTHHHHHHHPPHHKGHESHHHKPHPPSSSSSQSSSGRQHQSHPAHQNSGKPNPNSSSSSGKGSSQPPNRLHTSSSTGSSKPVSSQLTNNKVVPKGHEGHRGQLVDGSGRPVAPGHPKHHHQEKRSSLSYHSTSQQQHTKPSKRPHPPGEGPDRKKVKMESHRAPPLPPLSSSSSRDPLPPLPPSYPSNYSSSLPPLPRTAPPPLPLDDSPPPPPPRN